jgi:hypothetical protein
MSRPTSVNIAASLGILYAIVLLVGAIAMLYEYAERRGNLGHQTGPAAKGVVGFSIFLFIVSVALVMAVRRLISQRRRTMFIVILCTGLAFGTMGETIDSVGSATFGSDAIGLAILFLMALPVALLVIPSARTWFLETESFEELSGDSTFRQLR